MRKILFSIITLIILVLCIVTMWHGINVFGIEIIGMSTLKEKDTELEDSISEATRLASTDFEKALDDIDNDMKKLEQEKQSYQELISVNENGETQIATKYKKYEIEYLWAVLGNNATKEGLELKMDLVAGTRQNVYNLNFSVRGTYIGIANFISTIENDSALGFTIENFKMVPGGSTDDLQATFTCKNVEIEQISSITTNNTDTESTGTETSDTETSNTTSTNSSTESSSSTSETSNDTSSTDDTDVDTMDLLNSVN